jgi:glycosyltransferase involved in cell wall biosynthesis
MDKQVIFINSHPIQYFAPMYKHMNVHGIKTSCWYCSDSSIRGGFDQQFGVNVKWDIPLLDGYEYKFFKNYSWKPSFSNGFFGLINFSMVWKLFRIPKSVIVVHGWHYFTLFCILILGKICGHTICLRCELPCNQEILKTGFIQTIKKLGLKYILFPRINFFLYIGEQNRLFYKSFGLADYQLLFCPYSVDNERFRQEYANLLNSIPSIKQTSGIPLNAKTIVFSAKYIAKKRPLDILYAFAQINIDNLWLIMVGEGELRTEMEIFIRNNGLKNVILTGFINQSKISDFYAIGDLFVMCSGIGETWGLSVNEAMNFNLPLIISDISGCASDLVKPGVNGYTFKTGDVDDLTIKLKQVLLEGKLTKSISSIDIVDNYSYNTVSNALRTLL